jgi:tetratricopeptide (TPR) repeat protein
MTNRLRPTAEIVVAILWSLGVFFPPSVAKAQSVGQQAAELQRQFNQQLTAKDSKRAEQTALAMLQFVRTRLGGRPPLVGVCYVNLAQAYQQQSRYQEAEQALQAALPDLAKSADHFG